MELSLIAKEAVYSGSDDWVSVGEVVSFVTGWKMASTAGEALPIALKAITELVETGMMEIGSVDNGFRSWDQPLDESIRYIQACAAKRPGHEWSYAAWLQNTPRGNEYAETLDPDELHDGV